MDLLTHSLRRASFILFITMLLLGSCNLPLTYQKHLTKKMVKSDIYEKTYKNGIDNIHYFEGGIGDTVVLIHGFGADAQSTWNKSIFDLKDDYHLIVPDLLWFGKSHSTRSPNLTSQVLALTALLDDRNVKQYKVAGISYGGFVSLGMHQHDPQRVSSICIINSPGMTYNMALLDSLCKQEKVNTVDEIFVVKSPEEVERLFDLALYKDKRIPKGMKADLYELYFNQHHDKLGQLLATLPLEKKKFLGTNQIPFPKATVIWGANDAVFPLSEGKKLARFMNANLVEIPKAGHAVNIEQFKLFERALRAFLKAEK